MRCPYCGCTAVLRNKTELSWGRAWVCMSYPACDAYVGCHPGTDIPLGTMANADLRSWRRRAHDAFDDLWKSGRMSRGEAYQLLAQDLGIRIDKAHIGSFDVAQCQAVVAKWQCSEFRDA